MRTAIWCRPTHRRVTLAPRPKKIDPAACGLRTTGVSHQSVCRLPREREGSSLSHGDLPVPRPEIERDVRHDRACTTIHELLTLQTSEPQKLYQLAAMQGLSRFQLLRSFKRKYGLSPREYHVRLRIGLAQRALREGQPAAQVAAEYGFVDQSHMTRHFKRLLGVTPMQYASGRCPER